MSHQTLFYLDIETVPSQSQAVKSAIMDEIADEAGQIKAPGNYKDHDKIAEYISAEKTKLINSFPDRYRKTALSGTLGEVLCIGWAFDDDPVRHTIRTLGTPERDFLNGAWEAIHEDWSRHDHGGDTVWIGHNIRDFDIRFLFQRSVILGTPPGLTMPVDVGTTTSLIFDTMTRWAGWGNRISLDKLCAALGIPGKAEDGIDGSMVYDMALAGDYERIGRYCANDVERARKIHRRMIFATVDTGVEVDGVGIDIHDEKIPA